MGYESRYGGPVEVSSPSLGSRIYGFIRDNGSITVEMEAKEVQVSVHNVIHNHLNYRKTCGFTKHRQVTDAHNELSSISQDLKQRRLKKTLFSKK